MKHFNTDDQIVSVNQEESPLQDSHVTAYKRHHGIHDSHVASYFEHLSKTKTSYFEDVTGKRWSAQIN